MIKGYISYFRFKKGIGFINAEDGKSYFFHISKILDKNAFQGSEVTFDIEKTMDNDKAIDITTVQTPTTKFGIVKFHNTHERFGALYATNGETAFTQVTNDAIYRVGMPIRFEERIISMHDNTQQKRIAYSLLPLPQQYVSHGTIKQWDGVKGIFLTDAGFTLPFTLAEACSPRLFTIDCASEAIIIDNTIHFIHPIAPESTTIAPARIVNINPRQGYALAIGPGIPQAIIGNPPSTIRKGDYINGEFLRNARGFECTRHVVIPKDRVVYGMVTDNSTQIRPVNAPDLVPLPLPKEVIINSRQLQWKPRDGEICECLLAANGAVALVRQGHPFAAYAQLGIEEEAMVTKLASEIHIEDRHYFAPPTETDYPLLWAHLFRVYERHRSDTLLGAKNRFVSFSIQGEDGSIMHEAFATMLRNMNGQQIYAIFSVGVARPGRPSRKLVAFESFENANLLRHAPSIPERYLTAEGIDF